MKGKCLLRVRKKLMIIRVEGNTVNSISKENYGNSVSQGDLLEFLCCKQEVQDIGMAYNKMFT